MSELATVKAEIKAWERSFKDSNGRAPTVDDIKQNPSVADKYKLYKKLSKAAASSETTQKVANVPPPSTPPRKTRPKDPPTVLLSKSRPVKSPEPLSSFNPFSPQKKGKGKEKESFSVKHVDKSLSNPFPKLEKKKQIATTSSDLFPPLKPSQPSSSTISSTLSLNFNPIPTSAVSRARKRLRGEPVSPSPSKDKRRRISSQTILPFPRRKMNMSSSEDEEEEVGEANSSFVDNSPMKALIPGKSYQPLFNETVEPVDLFGTKGGGETQRNKLHKDSTNNGGMKVPGRRAKRDSNDSGQNNLDSSSGHNLSKLKSARTPVDSNSEVSSNRSSAKRTFEQDEIEDALEVPRAKSPLIPPSPPPGGASNPFIQPGKNKGKATTSRKKVKMNDVASADDDDNDDSESHAPKSKLRIVGRTTTRRQHSTVRSDEDAVTSDSDPILGYTRFTVPHASSQNDGQLQNGDVEVDLPDELRRVLALPSASSKGRVSEEERLVKGLIYGRRVNNYDPHKGGEIWDVGEDYNEDADGGNTEGEDDWEGEPVPWEVGEL